MKINWKCVNTLTSPIFFIHFFDDLVIKTIEIATII